jgi:hypothetical protein
MFDGFKRFAEQRRQRAVAGGVPLDGGPGAHRVRRSERACDQALTGTTRHWLLRLPARRRPLRLCLSYPRVANRIAWVWADAEVSAQVLVDLLQDQRGGRQGFPPSVTRELRRLQDFNTQQRRETQPEGVLQIAGRLFGVM